MGICARSVYKIHVYTAQINFCSLQQLFKTFLKQRFTGEITNP